jgi:hypothetical protein
MASGLNCAGCVGNTQLIERANLKHLNPAFGKMLVCDIRAEDVALYQGTRLAEQAAPKTVDLEVGTLRAVLRRNRLWFAIQQEHPSSH